MNTRTRTTLIILIAVLVIVIAGIALFAHRRTGGTTVATSTAATTTNAAASSTAASTSSAAAITGSGYTVTPVSAPEGPDPAAPLSFSADIDAAAQASMRATFAADQNSLALNPLDFNAWISIGGLRKTAGDYAGAAADWEYMSTLYPKNPISYANLADLYANYSHNYPKAADDYLKAIQNDPAQLYLYDDFYQLWHDKYPASGASLEAALKAGIKANPSATHLQDLLTDYNAAA